MGSFVQPGTRALSRKGSEVRRLWPQANPEAVFLAWLLRLPDDADVAAAAREEIARLDRAAPLPPGPARLRELMIEAAGSRPHPTRRRSRT